MHFSQGSVARHVQSVEGPIIKDYGAFSLRNALLHIHEPTNQSVLSKFVGHFDWLAH